MPLQHTATCAAGVAAVQAAMRPGTGTAILPLLQPL